MNHTFNIIGIDPGTNTGIAVYTIDTNFNILNIDTYTILLNKTFETIITNLNNLNQGRIVLDQDKMNPIKIWDLEIPDPDDFTKTTIVHLNTVDREAALYWIECVKKIFTLTAPVK